MEQDVSRLKGKVLTDQLNISVEPELRARFKRLKLERNVDVTEEIRKNLRALAARLEKACDLESAV
jgi:hypothetical protein